MQIIQTVDGSPISAVSADVSVTDTPQNVLTLLSMSLANDARHPKYALIYVSTGLLSISSRALCPEGEGIAVEQGQLVRLNGYPEINMFYLRTYTVGLATTVSIELEY